MAHQHRWHQHGDDAWTTADRDGVGRMIGRIPDPVAPNAIKYVVTGTRPFQSREFAEWDEARAYAEAHLGEPC